MSPRECLQAYALSFLGTPYRWGGDDPLGGIDCSGLTIELLQAAGLLSAHYDATAQGLYDKFESEEDLDVSEFGTLLFFGQHASAISHVAFALNQTQMLEAGGGGRTVVDRASAERANAFVRIRPIAWRTDCVAKVRPPYFWG